MKISFIAQYSDIQLVVERSGDTLSINGTSYDFSTLPASATLPNAAIDCPYIVGDVERDSEGVLHITLLLPIQRAIFFDDIPPIIDPPNGPIALPVITEMEVEND